MRLLLTQEQIQLGIKKVSEKIHMEIIESKNDLPPVFICVLRGGFMFFNELVKNLSPNIEIDFIQASSYKGKDNSGGVKITSEIKTDLKGKQVYLIDDLVDTGNTIREILFHLEDYRPADIKIVTAFHRKNSPNYVDHYACEIGDEWLVGFGLDCNGLKRNTSELYAL